MNLWDIAEVSSRSRRGSACVHAESRELGQTHWWATIDRDELHSSLKGQRPCDNGDGSDCAARSSAMDQL